MLKCFFFFVVEKEMSNVEKENKRKERKIDLKNYIHYVPMVYGPRFCLLYLTSQCSERLPMLSTLILIHSGERKRKEAKRTGRK